MQLRGRRTNIALMSHARLPHAGCSSFPTGTAMPVPESLKSLLMGFRLIYNIAE